MTDFAGPHAAAGLHFSRGTPMIDPRGWDTGVVARALTPDVLLSSTDALSATAESAMVVGSTGPLAQLAGMHALRDGGSAVDAVIATALTQIALAAGSWVSYAGVFCMVHFDADRQQTASLSAGFAGFRDEDDPASIPAPPVRSGRTALVPGFMAGAQAAHDRYGALDWGSLFAPAIFVAKRGFPVGALRAAQFGIRADVLPPSFHATPGQVFCQPELAATLTSIAQHGADWMYRGPWAARFVDAVRAAGGRAVLADLVDYQPIWSAPLRAEVAGHDVHTLGAPDFGGQALLDALIRAADVADPLTDSRALAELIAISRQTSQPGSHSDFAVAVDARGNIAALCHSINTSLWGQTAIFVDGVSIPDAASFQQPALARLRPGEHLPFVANPAIVLRDGRPVLASAAIGAGLHEVTLQCLHAILTRRVPLPEAVRRPLFHGPDSIQGDSVNSALTVGHDEGSPDAQVIEDGFDPDVLAEVLRLGQPLSIRPTGDWTIPRGYWGGVAIGERLTGGRTGFTDGIAVGDGDH